jgi:ankyrin repeat protein
MSARKYAILFLLFVGNLLTLSHSKAQDLEPDTSDYMPEFIKGGLEYNLILASERGYSSEIERLILRGAEVNAKTAENATALVFAVLNNMADAVKTLLYYEADPNQVTYTRETPILIAVKNNNPEVAEVLIRYGADLSYKDNHGSNALHYAVINGYIQLTDMLLYYEADIDAKTKDGTTALMAAVWSGFYDIAELLIKNGANLEARDNEGFTPFLIAAQNGDTLIMSLLADKGVDIYARNVFNIDALALTIQCDKPEATEYLLKMGNKWGKTGSINPYNIAVKYGRPSYMEILDRYKIPSAYESGFNQLHISLSPRTNIKDYYTGFSILLKEPLRNFGLLAGMDAKLWHTRVLVDKGNDLVYQYLDRGYMAHLGINKDFPVGKKNYIANNYLYASLGAGYSFSSNYKGTRTAPEDRVRIIPAFGYRFVKENLSFHLSIEYTGTEFYQQLPIWGRAGITYIFYFNETRSPLKIIRW